MADDPNTQRKVQVSTTKYQITYFADRDEFLLEFADPLRLGNVLIEQYVLRLDGEVVRQMADVLPPRDPETVH